MHCNTDNFLIFYEELTGNKMPAFETAGTPA